MRLRTFVEVDQDTIWDLDELEISNPDPSLKFEREPEEEEEEEEEVVDDTVEMDDAKALSFSAIKNPHYYRAKTKFEKEVNFKQIETNLDSIEAAALKKIIPELQSVKVRFLKFIQSKFDYDARFVRNLRIRGFSAVSSKIADFLLESYNAGVRAMAKELDVTPKAKIAMTAQELLVSIKKHQETPDFRPRDAERYLKTKTFWITGIIDGKLREKSRGILLRAIQTGEALPKTIQKLGDIFEPYVGDPKKIRDDEVVNPFRLETIVRTNATDAFNQGRIVEARKAGELLSGFQYSAVLDQVTTDVCRELDGKVFRPNDPLLDQLRPPRHYNCFIDEKINIFTVKGWMPIGNVKLGDLVLTHRGRFRQVNFVHHDQAPTSYCGEVVKVMTRFDKNSANHWFTVTPDHPVLTDEGWCLAKNLRRGTEIKVLAKGCLHCDKEIPWFDWGPKYCSRICMMQHIWAEGNGRPEMVAKIVATRKKNGGYVWSRSMRIKQLASWTKARKRKQSKAASLQMQREYANGTRDGKKITRAAHRVTGEMYARGEGPLNDKRIRAIAYKARMKSKKWWHSITVGRTGSKNPMSKQNPSVGSKRGRKKLSRTLRRLYTENPDLHINRRMGQAVLRGHEGYISKGHLKLMKTAKRIFKDVDIEHPVLCGDRRFFIDVALTKRKIGLEFDGAHWHKNTNRDRRRDALLLKYGWGIIRYRERVPTSQELMADIERLGNNHDHKYKYTTVRVQSVKLKQLKCARQLYNLSVQGDESYIAKGFVVHNCRSVVVPIGLDEEIEEDDYISEVEAAEAMELSGEDFGGPPGSTGFRGASFLKKK